MQNRACMQGIRSRTRPFHHLTWVALAAALSACGGGGGSPDSTPNQPQATTTGQQAQPYALTVDGGVIAASFNQGTTPSIVATIRLDRPIAEPVNVAIVDQVGVLQPTITLTPLSTTSYRATVLPVASLSAGHHTGQIEVRICYDAPMTCARPVAGAPWQVSYDFDVMAVATPPALPVPPAPVTPAAYTVVRVSSPVVLNLADDDLPLSVRVYGVLSGAPSSSVVPRFVAPSGVFTAGPVTTAYDSFSGYQVYADLNIDASVKPGVYQGQIELRTCVDEACTSQHSEPGVIGYSVAIAATSNLTPLKAMAGAQDWSTDQGNASHTGYVPIRLDPAKFNQRWRRYVGPFTGNELTGVATANDSVFVGVRARGATSSLFAIKEGDKTTLWSYDFPLRFTPSTPATAGKLVYVASTDGYGHIEPFDQVSGVRSGFQGFLAQFDEYSAPTPYGSAVYNSAGQHGGLASFDLAVTKTNWLNKDIVTGGATPAVDDKQLYIYRNDKLDIIDKATGLIQAEITGGTIAGLGTPALTSQGHVVVCGGSFGLSVFDPVSKTALWTVKGDFAGQPAVANGVIYVPTTTEFQARSEADGHLLWSWKPTLFQEAAAKPFDAASLNVVVTDNVAFVSSATAVYAIDLDSKTAVWRHPASGRLAISRNGVLYITPLHGTNFSRLTAINLY